ncbi:MAG: oligosaccharide flippase family protein [Oscillospiraceae bacterium]|jgi:stage V sporulation protein B|nr:oligosaccharide flippase family protein [Oscillospiraceae bacterium]
MKKQSLLSQTAVLTATNGVVRAIGFGMRIWMSRTLGAEAIGIMELASSAHMLWLAPVTSGLPMAVSRYTAQAVAAGDELRASQTLMAGKRLARVIAWPMMLAMLILTPWISRILGDTRTLPTLLMYLPCLPILAASAVYNGYCYGKGNTAVPAVTEFVEQAVRFGICFAVLTILPAMRAAYSAAVPALGVAIGEGIGLIIALAMLRPSQPRREVKLPPGLMKKLWRLAFPMTCMRLSNTLMRTVNAALIPMRLRASGLSAAEATARLGMYHGMAMSLVMLPAVFTGALAMVSAPAITARENDPEAMKRLLKRVMIPAAAVSFASMCALWIGAPFCARVLYKQAELEPLLKTLSPCVLLLGIQQVISGLMAGLGQQRRALYASLSGSLLTVGLNYALAASPQLRLTGVAIATTAGLLLTLMMNARALSLAVTRVELRFQAQRA